MPNTPQQLTSSSAAPEIDPPASKPLSEFQQTLSEDCQTVIGTGGKDAVVDGFFPLSVDNAAVSEKFSSGNWPSWGSSRDQSSLLLEPRNCAEPTDGLGFSETKPARVGAGLDNLGNTCFMNAILQCFTHTSLLVQGLRRSSSSYNCDSDGFCVLCALREHVEAALSSPGRSIAPITFSDNIKYISSNFERGQQEDAHEFLQCLLDRLEECCLGSRSKDKCSSQRDNIVEQIFSGGLKSRLRCCNCGHCSDTPERLIDLSLEIDNADTLVSALESFTKVERIEDSEQIFTCENCKEKVSVEKQLKLEKLPSVAAIHLKRFKADGYRVEKISKHVDFPLELDFEPYCIDYHDNNGDLKYDLYAVVVHDGFSSDSGHYYCYVRSSPDVWYKLDDWKVTRVQETSVLLEDGYMLFYTKQGTTWISDLIEVPKCFEPNNSNTSPNSVLENRGSACSPYGSPLNCNGYEDFGSRECRKVPNYLFSSEIRHGELEVDQTRPSEEGNSRQNGANVEGYCGSTINYNEFQSGPSNYCSKIYDSEEKVFTSFDGEYNRDLEAEDKDNIINPVTPSTSPNGDMHILDHSSYDMACNSLKSEERVKCKRPMNKLSDSSEIREAMRLAKRRMPMSRGSKLIAAFVETQNEHSSKEGKRAGSSPCPKGSSSSSARRHNDRNVLRTLRTATLK